MFKFGAVSESYCEFDLSKLVKWDPSDLPQSANTFFDLFILNAEGNLIDVPVLIRNYRGVKGAAVNSGDFSDSWQFTRRFFVYDTLSGIDQVNGFANKSVPNVVRWADSIKFKISLDPTTQEHIYTPWVEITY